MTETNLEVLRSHNAIPSEDLINWFKEIAELSISNSSNTMNINTSFFSSPYTLELIVYVLNGKRFNKSNPLNAYSLEKPLAIYAAAPTSIKKIIGPIVAEWKESVYGKAI
jgi:hypothetical protein